LRRQLWRQGVACQLPVENGPHAGLLLCLISLRLARRPGFSVSRVTTKAFDVIGHAEGIGDPYAVGRIPTPHTPDR
jgi:hypothetical protein